MQEIRILLVEDDEDDFIIIRDFLKEAWDVPVLLEWKRDADSGLQAIERRNHDIYLLDYRLGARNGLELLEEAKKLGVDGPFVLLTGLGDISLDKNAISLGAADYLVKGQFDSQLLSRSIRYAIDRQNSRRKIVDSESRYRILFESNPEAIWVFRVEDKKILAANDAACELLQYSAEEFVKLTMEDLVSEGAQSIYEFLHATHDGFFKNGKHCGVVRFIGKYGMPIHGETLVNNIYYESYSAVMIVAIDVTEKIAAQNARARQEQVFRNVLSDARDAMLVISCGGEIFYANRAAELVFESALKDLKNYPPIFPSILSSVFEWEYVSKTGKTRCFDVHQSETEWEGQKANLLSLRDITEQKKSQSELRLFKRTLDCSYNGVVISDAKNPSLPIIYVNSAFERITGYKSDEVIGKNCRFLQGNIREDDVVNTLRQGLDQKRDINAIVKNYRKDGSLFWNDLYISPVFDEDGLVSHFVGVQNDVTERKRFEEELSFNANHDLLTGLPNRAVFEDRLFQGFQISQRYSRKLAVVFIDLDRFKPINDSYGHDVGDLLLVEVARRIQLTVRPGDTVSRLGGDEFIVLLPDLAKEQDVILVVDRLMVTLAEQYSIRGVLLHVTPSIGIALSDGSQKEPVSLIQQADMAMYRAKEEGRNNYQWYTGDLNQQLLARLTLRNELQNAIKEDQFELHYQPQVDAKSGRVVGLEALVRWRHPVRGLVSPVQFISVAEDSGLMIPMGQWILETACNHISQLARQGFRNLSMAVNISPRQFHRSNFVETIQSLVDRYGLQPGMLEIELTESVLIDDIDQAIFCLDKIKNMGVSISLDDFGTGYSSLSYLKNLPIDKVKIDRSFVREIISDRHDAAIAQAIIAMAHHLRLKVVAEGVENESQISFLLKNHCDELQGFYFARPMPFADILDFLRNQLLKGLVIPSSNEGATQTLLLLDDEENILRALNRVLRRDGYKILMATKPQDAFELLAKHDVQVIISDQRMPEMSGTEFLSRVKDIYPNTVRIVLSGYTDLKSVTDAVNQGAIYKFLSKPWEDDQLRKEISQVFIHSQSIRARPGSTR